MSFRVLRRDWWSGGLGLLLLGMAPGVCRAEDDVRSWHSLEVVKKLSAAWEVYATPQLRTKDDLADLSYHEYRQGLRWQPVKYLQVGLNYLFVRNETSGRPLEEHAGELDLTPKYIVGPWDLSVRWRGELRSREGNREEEEWRFRLRPKVSYRTKLGPLSVSPYVASDVFYDNSADAWNENRLFLGSVIPIGRTGPAAYSIDLYYMLQSQRGERKDWSSNHILGTILIVRF